MTSFSHLKFSCFRHLAAFLIVLGIQAEVLGAGEMVTHYEYGDQNLPTRVYVCDGTEAGATVLSDTCYRYDHRGRQWVIRKRVSAGISDNAHDVISSRWYDSWGRNVRNVTYGIAYNPAAPGLGTSLDTVVAHGYDAMGRLTQTIGPAPNAVTMFEYDDSGNTTRKKVKYGPGVTDWMITETSYDTLNRPVRITDPEGHILVRTYSSRVGVVLERTYAATDAQFSQPLTTTRMSYDLLGNLSGVVKYADASHTGNPNKAVDSVLHHGKRVDGQPSQITTYNMGSISPMHTYFEYDGIGRQTKTIDPKSHWTSMQYDEKGMMTQKVVYDGIGQRTFTHEYDSRSRLTRQVAQGTVNNLVTAYQYDAMSRPTLETDPEGKSKEVIYNLLGQPIRKNEDVGGANRATDSIYDRRGRLVGLVAYSEESAATPPANIASVPSGAQLTEYRYDPGGRRTKIIYPDSENSDDVVVYNYDYAGRLTSITDQRQVTTNYEYNRKGLLTRRISGAMVDEYGYDAVGRMTNATRTEDATQISNTIFAYDDMSRLTTESQSVFGGTPRVLHYGYDQAGNRTQMDYPADAGVSLSYSYDSLNRVDQVKRSVDGGATWSDLIDYDYDGQFVSTRKVMTNSQPTPGEVVVQYGWDEHRRRNQIINSTSDGGTTWDQYDYTFDMAGNRTGAVAMGGLSYPVSEMSYSYDGLHRLTSVDYAYSGGSPIGREAFVYDQLGNRIDTNNGVGYSLSWLGEVSGISYGPINTVNEYTSIGNVPLQYDGAGNLTVDETGLIYEYDHQNRLTRIRRQR